MNVRDHVTTKRVVIVVIALVLFSAPLAGMLSGNRYTSGATFQTDSGVAVTFEFNQTLEGNPFSSSTTFEGTGGSVSAQSTGYGDLDLAQWGAGSQTTVVNDLNTTPVVVVNPDQSTRLGVNGSATEVRWDNVTADDGTADVTVTATGSEYAGLTFVNVTPGDNYRLISSGGSTAELGTADGSGEVYFSVDNSDTYTLQSYENDLPSITNLDPSEKVVQDPITLAADVDDDTLPGSNVTVTWRVNGQQVNTATTTSAGEVNYTLTKSELPGAGESSWSLTAEDKLGATATETATFYIAGNMTVRNVSDPSQIITTAEATIYTESGTITRQADANGNISLKDLPANQPLIFEITAPDYKDRTTTIPSVAQASDGYLISNNTTTVLNRFTLQDPSGNFPPESVIYIKRPVTLNNSTSYRVVAADESGVEGFDATLVQDQRYRITIVSPDGDVAQLGKYVATQSEEIPLRPETAAVRLDGGKPYGFNATVKNGDLQIQYNDSAGNTEVLTVYVVNRFNDSDYLIEPQTYYDTNSLSLSEPVPNGELSDSYRVVIEGQRNSSSFTASQFIGPDQISIVPQQLSTVWIQVFGIGLVLVIGGVFSTVNVGVGAVVTSLMAGILWFVGLLGGVATWGTITAAIVFSVGYAMVMQQ